MIELTDKTFGIVTESSGTFILELYTDYCNPCKMVAADLVKFEQKSDVRVGKINAVRYPAIARQCKLEHIPTIILFIDGEERERFVGRINFEEVVKPLL